MRTNKRNNIPAMWVLAMVSFLSITTIGCDGTEPAVVRAPETAVDESGSPSEHVAKAEGYTVRASAIRSDMLPLEMLREHGIQAGADRGVMNVVVLKQGPDGQEVTVAADVTAQQSNLIGQSREIEMRAVTANDGTSFLGTFEYSPQDFFRFTITAQPVGTDKVLSVEFEERSAVLR